MWPFYIRLLKRQSRLPAIRLFCLAVSLSCAVLVTISLLSDRLEQLFQQQSKEVLGADLLFESTTPLQTEISQLFDRSQTKQARTVGFQTMASTEDAFLLSSVKAVSENYPLRGALQVSDKLYGDVQVQTQGPEPGEAWVEDRVLNELNMVLGDVLMVGEKSLKVTRVLVYEPDRGNSFYSFTPRIMMSLQDLAATEVIQLGSRVKYRYLFSGSESVLEKLKTEVESLAQANQKFVTIESANETLATTLDRAYQFLNITALIAVLLGAVGVALVSFQYSEEMTYQYAVLRCLGLRGKALKSAIILPFLGFAVCAIVVGLGVGVGAHFAVLYLLRDLLPDVLPMPSWRPFALGVFTALIVIVSFASPFLKRLITTPPKQLLSPVESQRYSWLSMGLMMGLGLLLLVELNIRNLSLSMGFLLSLSLFVFLAYGMMRLLIRLLLRCSHLIPPRMRLSVRVLHANRSMNSLQVVAIAITFFSLALIQTLRDDLIETWQGKVPEGAPNFFVINLFEEDSVRFQAALAERNIAPSPLYPIVRGRLTGINGKAVRDVVSKESRGERATQRDLSLTWSSQLPEDNVIDSGVWHGDELIDPEKTQEKTQNVYRVSVETELAENMGIQLGDQLDFTINTQRLSARVSSLRSVDWQSFTPNFYMMFEPSALENFASTYIASFYMTPEQRKGLSEMIAAFPTATFFDVDFLLNRIRSISQQVGFAIESVLYFALFASVIVFVSIEMILKHNRQYTTAICKAMGAQTPTIQSIFKGQFVLIGLMSGCSAYVLNLMVSFALSVWVLDSQFVFNLKTAILCLLIAPALVYLIGQFSINKTRHQSAKQLLSA